MAIFFLGMKTFGRSRGKSGSRATSAAAYRAGERLRDERTGRVYDHRHRADVMHKEIVLPARLAAHSAALEWARDRSRLWNAAEHAESRSNARVAREFTVGLPHELPAEARTHLARQFAQQIADRYGSAVDVVIHAPRGDARNFHAHLLATTREVTPEGLGPKTTLELSGTQRHQLGLPRWREEVAALRNHWAALTNGALERAHIVVRVSPLTQAERGLTPGPARLPLAAYHIERRGERSFIADRVRERYHAMLERVSGSVQAQLVGPEGLARERNSVPVPGSFLKRLEARAKSAWQILRGKSEEHSVVAAVSARREAVEARETVEAREAVGARRAREAAPAGAEPLHPSWNMFSEAQRDAARDWLEYYLEKQARRSAGIARPHEHDPDREQETERHDHPRDYGLGL